MNKERLTELAIVLNSLLGENEPSDEELGFNDDLMELYDDLHNVKESLKKCGFWDF